MNQKKKWIIITCILLCVSILYTILVKFVDVSAIGPKESVVGFSTFNKAVHDAISYHDTWYKISKYCGYLAFLYCAFYGLIGVIQLVKGKSFKKVDQRILLLGCFYVLMFAVYFFFEKVIINYRPVLMEGLLEASYPSSHTILAICICSTSLMISKFYLKNDSLLKIVDIITWILMITIVVSRILSGVHWMSDILGGYLISGFLISLYYTLLLEKKKERSE